MREHYQALKIMILRGYIVMLRTLNRMLHKNTNFAHIDNDPNSVQHMHIHICSWRRYFKIVARIVMNGKSTDDLS